MERLCGTHHDYKSSTHLLSLTVMTFSTSCNNSAGFHLVQFLTSIQGKQGIMWPLLVVNKILRKRLGSNNFVADFPRSPTETSPSSKNQFTDHDSYKIFVGSWNVGGLAPPEDLEMEDWLNTQNSPADIYVLGFQEIVPLNAANVLGCDNSKISTTWNSLIRKSLNNTIIDPIQGDKIGEYQRVCPLKEHRHVPLDFQCVISKQMVGIFISVWVRGDLCRYIRHPSVSCVGCGILGCLGNKGSVSVRFFLQETSFCFVCSHLSSGGIEGDHKHRNANANEILTRTSFPCGPMQNLPPKILDHDRVIWLGDLNYRIYLSDTSTRSLVEKRDWNNLLGKDQLKAELMEGHVFEGWQEGAIEFAPTYKYYPNSQLYYGSSQKIKGEKRRTPAWCDRIIWFGKGLKQNQYGRGESKLSDHRPVRAIFTAEVEVLQISNAFESFLSKRFNC